MGLDIFFYHAKKSVIDKYNLSRGGTFNETMNALTEVAKNKYKKTTDKMLQYLTKQYTNMSNKSEYDGIYSAFIGRLQKNIPFYRVNKFKLLKFGYNALTKTLDTKTPIELKEIFKETLFTFSPLYSAYFSKSNFIYAYFQNNLNDECCFCDKNELNRLIYVCKDVLAHKNNVQYAEEHLPTCSGFFFDDTDYDEWYWKNVEDCIKQLSKVYKKMDDDDMLFCVFSW